MKVASIAKGTFISSRDTLQDAQKERKRLLAVMPKVSQYGTFELFCEPYEGIWAVFMYKNLTEGFTCLNTRGMTYALPRTVLMTTSSVVLGKSCITCTALIPVTTALHALIIECGFTFT